MKKNKISYKDLQKFKKAKEIKSKANDFKFIQENLIRVHQLETGDNFEMNGIPYLVDEIKNDLVFYSCNGFSNCMPHYNFKFVKLLKP